VGTVTWCIRWSDGDTSGTSNLCDMVSAHSAMAFWAAQVGALGTMSADCGVVPVMGWKR
jgi:hypothetical protein